MLDWETKQLADHKDNEGKAPLIRQDFSYDIQGLTTDTFQYVKFNAEGRGLLDGETAILHQDYDDFSLCVKTSEKIKYGEDDSVKAFTSATFDHLHRPRTHTDPLQYITAWDYQTTDLFAIQQTDPNMCVHKTTYNAAQGPILSIDTNASKETRITTFQRDVNNREIRATDPAKRWQQTFYEGLHREGLEISQTGIAIQHEWDAVHRFQRITHYVQRIDVAALEKAAPESKAAIALSLLQKDAEDQVSYQVFDSNHHLQYTVDAEGYVIEQRYNLRGDDLGTIAYADPITVDQLNALQSGAPF